MRYFKVDPVLKIYETPLPWIECLALHFMQIIFYFYCYANFLKEKKINTKERLTAY